MEHLDGHIFTDPALPDIAPSARAAVYQEMGSVLAALHSVDPTTCGLHDFGKHTNCNERQVGNPAAASPHRITTLQPPLQPINQSPNRQGQKCIQLLVASDSHIGSQNPST
eukprot:7377826-Pyramimonas_sp.AAC.1